MSTANISKPGQYHHENRTWTRLLEFFKQENTILKNRLAEVLDHNTDKEFLAKAEQFQNRFIIQDEFIDELRHDINLLDRNLVEKGDSLPEQVLVKKQEKLRNEMEYFEKDFSRLKNEFNKYLASVV